MKQENVEYIYLSWQFVQHYGKVRNYLVHLSLSPKSIFKLSHNNGDFSIILGSCSNCHYTRTGPQQIRI